MNSLDEQYGYDANFISDVWESLKCNVCHLVMREPVQIMTCGHRFCKPCFERLKGYATHLNTQLRCPIDRDAIEIDKVFNDTAVSRDIGNLQVTCSYVAFGCSWKGDLRNLTDHEKECQHQINQNMPNQNQVANTDVSKNVAELLKRVQNCENTLNEKEKDLALMKYDIHEMKKKYEEKENEVTALKTMNEEICLEMSETKKINEKMKEHFKSEIETLEKRNEGLETRLESLETQTKGDSKVIAGKFNLLETQIDANEATIMECKDSLVSKIQLEDFKADITNKIESLETQIESNETAEKENKESFVSKLDSLEKLHMTFRKDTIHHLENIENVMFCHEPYSKEKNVKIKWVMTNFQKNYDSGESVFSPRFYTSLQGYCIELYVKWSGDNRQYLGWFLHIFLNKDTPVEQDEERDPFRIEYDFEIRHKDGRSKVHSVKFANLDKHREDCFTILPNKDEARDKYGNLYMLDKSTWDDYVINDMMLITCTFRTR